MLARARKRKLLFLFLIVDDNSLSMSGVLVNREKHTVAASVPITIFQTIALEAQVNVQEI